MFEDYTICPYTGLRSFTEEESLYFKGREEHIEQATEQLQRNKFLMLTGASGDGKSSLVYAGIIPNARAGFLKSKYSQWCVADFRPERSPFKNLCKAIARQLGISNASTVESELQHGFSALTDLYRNSKRFADTESVAWSNADESGKAALKRDAANLIILVDQFEEFFTNPENYRNGVPSRDSNLVLNVLLETARIALDENLPIYIVFTMRSDYIGQCAAFRSLPEYIGFSQFFVPRLNRSQLQQVIEEPAVLSGNRISRRLTERLIHDIAEGVDQLPILQHALNQIWHAANQGKDEMDLIHYSMVGGMAPGDLPDEQAHHFAEWFGKLPESIKHFYREPNLQNVLDTHANKLFESAAESYRSNAGVGISEDVVKAIVKTAFTCLTKIDQSRAVRNRMTLQEITNILGQPEIGVREVSAVLNIFRESGNTFIRPFITDDPESNTLSESDVLDITHESLIRNWEHLEAWAKEEFDNYLIWLDFEKQLDRWVQSNKANGFLLSIGPLTYFENWYQKVRPNAWWIARYLPEDTEQKQSKAEVMLSNAKEFIERSASKHVVTRTVIRYGPRKIAAMAAVIALVMLSSFAAINYWHQRNAYILTEIKKQSLVLANSTKIDFASNSTLLAEELRSGTITIKDIVANVKDSLTRINCVRRLAGWLVMQGQGKPRTEILDALRTTHKLLGEYSFQKSGVKKLEQYLREVNYLRATLGLAYLYDPQDEIQKIAIENAERSLALVNYILQTQPTSFKEITGFNQALENAINYKVASPDQISKILTIISPFENTKRSAWVKDQFAQNKIEIIGNFNYGFKFNGLYQELAYLYATSGNTAKTLQCIDTLLKYNDGYYQKDYTGMSDNASNIAAVFFTYYHAQQFDSFVNEYCRKKNISVIEFYQRLIGRTNPNVKSVFNSNENGSVDNLNLQFGSLSQLEFFFQHFRESIEKLPNADDRNFNLALSYKEEGILKSTRYELGGKAPDKSLYPLFEKAMKYYGSVSKSFLARPVKGEELEFSGNWSAFFLYPDHRNLFMPFEIRGIYYPFNSDAFIRYILDNNLFETLYTDAELPLFSEWIGNYFVNKVFQQFVIRAEMNEKTLPLLESKLNHRNASRYADLNMLYLLMSNDASGMDTLSDQYYRDLDVSKLMNSLRFSGPFGNNINNRSFSLMAFVLTDRVKQNHFDEAYKIIKIFKNPINRSSLYAFIATELMEQNSKTDLVQQLIDSARIELTRIKNLSTGQPNRQLIAYALALQNPDKNVGEAYKTIKNISDKFNPTLSIARAFAFDDNLFGAQQNIIQNISDQDQAQFLATILNGYAQSKGETQSAWKQYDEHLRRNRRFINYVSEDN